MRKPSPSRRSTAARTLAAATLAVAGLLPLAVTQAQATPPVDALAKGATTTTRTTS